MGRVQNFTNRAADGIAERERALASAHIALCPIVMSRRVFAEMLIF
jgi:hypothetical protein